METINQPATLGNSIGGDIFSWSRWPQKSEMGFSYFCAQKNVFW
jgi:hypothetical protein